MHKIAITFGAILFLLAISIGAFGAHALEAILLKNNSYAYFKTGNHYHFYQALGLMLLGVIWQINPQLQWQKSIFSLQLLGVFLFSASLYLMAVTGIRALGMVTPFGGTVMIIAWLMFLVSLKSMRTHSNTSL